MILSMKVLMGILIAGVQGFVRTINTRVPEIIRRIKVIRIVRLVPGSLNFFQILGLRGLLGFRMIRITRMIAVMRVFRAISIGYKFRIMTMIRFLRISWIEFLPHLLGFLGLLS